MASMRCTTKRPLLGLNVTRPQILETTAMGAAFLAGLAVGVWPDQVAIRNLWQEEKTFVADISRENADQKMESWSRAVERSKDWIVQ